MGWWIDASPSPPLSLPPGWLPSRPNGGWAYRDRIPVARAGLGVVAFYAGRYGHSSAEAWERRLAAGEISRNGVPLRADAVLVGGDRLVWQRPPWPEPAVPAHWGVIHDDGDLLVIDKPSGLPVLRVRLVPVEPPPPGPLVAFAGIGRPQKLFDSLAEAGGQVADAVPFADHHPYTKGDLQFLRSLARDHGARLITTSKDHVR
ncbi:tetraacyldisaccharide 4'-kinase, partial [Synechococcus sp. BA-120 BA3]|nr:tetraacyldisaccharide 4'-kinase [Synechococcus sp. BA-120 BA3]